MKTLNRLIIFLLVVSCSSCLKREFDIHSAASGRENHPLRAVMESASDSRTALKMGDDGSFNIFWTAGDSLGVVVDHDSTEIYPYDLGSQTEASSATFNGNAVGDYYEAFYPFSWIRGYGNGSFSIEIPSTYHYAEGAFPTNSFPMVAASRDTTLYFSNLFSVLRFSVRGRYKIRSIVLEANDSLAKLSGRAFVRNNSIVMTGRGSNRLKLDNVNVCLDSDTETDFYFTLPPQEYKGGFTVIFYTESGYVRKVSSADALMERSQMRSSRLNLTELTEGDEPVDGLKGLGTEDSPYLVGNLAELLFIGKSDPFQSWDGKYFKLTADISLKMACGEGLGNWIPLNDRFFNVFHGNLDGDGHTISDLYIHCDKGHDFGLFYGVCGKISNLTVIGDIYCPNSSDVGLLCGINEGATIVNCVSKGSVTGRENVGGLSGLQYRPSAEYSSNYTGCVNFASVTARSALGGLAGHYAATIDFGDSLSAGRFDRCANYGPVKGVVKSSAIGGIAGFVEGYVSVVNCVNCGAVDGENGCCGGIVGELYNGSVANCYNLGDISNSVYVSAGIVGYNKGRVLNCYNAGYVKSPYYTAAIAGMLFSSLSHCFWNSGVSGADVCVGIERDGSVMEGCEELSREEMLSPSFVEKLNEWVDSIPEGYSYWKQTDALSYPSLDFEDASSQAFNVMRNVAIAGGTTVDLEPEEYDFDISVYSSFETSTESLPHWIRLVGKSEPVNDTAVFHFRSEANHSSDKRTSSISFRNTLGRKASVSVLQHEEGYYASTDFGRDGELVVKQMATVGNGIDVVVTGDAFTDRDIEDGTFGGCVDAAVEALFSKEPFRSFRDYFNVYVVTAVSRDGKYYSNGGSTALGCSLGEGTHISGDNDRVLEYVSRAVGQDRVDECLCIVLLNVDRYAGTTYMRCPPCSSDYGSGFSVAYCALGRDDEEFREIVRHEAGGHGFAKLGDEYVTKDSVISEDEISILKRHQSEYGWYRNVDFTSEKSSVIWAAFLTGGFDNENLGVYEGAATYAYGVYRPSLNSIMRYNQGQFNAPSREAIFYRIHRLAYGKSREYSFDEFMRYDVYNRNLIFDIPMTKAQLNSFVPLSSPVVLEYVDF